MSSAAIASPLFHSQRQTRLILLSVAMTAALLTTGCKQSPTAEQVRLELEDRLPGAEFERQSHIHLGRLSMAAVRQLMRFTLPQDSPERQIVVNLKRVDVATYRVVSLPEGLLPSKVPALNRHLEQAGWMVAVQEKDFDERTWVIYREDDKGSIRSLCVISLDTEELEVVSVDGRLDELLAQAIAEDPGGFVQSLGS